jgi:hypothetical protein
MQYYTYLLNLKSENDSEPKLLTFETSTENLINLKKGYCELIIDNFFSSFSNYYDCIFISEYDPMQNPVKLEKKFLINFNDVEQANEILKKLM